MALPRPMPSVPTEVSSSAPLMLNRKGARFFPILSSTVPMGSQLSIKERYTWRSVLAEGLWLTIATVVADRFSGQIGKTQIGDTQSIYKYSAEVTLTPEIASSLSVGETASCISFPAKASCFVD